MLIRLRPTAPFGCAEACSASLDLSATVDFSLSIICCEDVVDLK
jgi:hypothetical protein